MITLKKIITSLAFTIFATHSHHVLLAQKDISITPGIHANIDIKTLEAMSEKLIDEATEIKFLSMAINKALVSSKSNTSRLGSTIKRYDIILAIIMTVVLECSILLALGCGSSKWDNQKFRNDMHYLGEKQRDFGLSSDEQIFLCCPMILFFVFWYAVDIFGKRLEDRPAWCKSALAILMKNWDTYASSIPESIQEIFSELINDFDRKTRTFKVLNDKRAQEIVDKILDLHNILTQCTMAQRVER
jgi:hypothetical protein